MLFDKLNYKSNIIQNGMLYSLMFYFSSQREYDECIIKYHEIDKIKTKQRIKENKRKMRIIEFSQQWKKDNPEKVKESRQRAYERIRAQPIKCKRYLERMKEYNLKNREHINEYRREYRLKNNENIKEHDREYALKNREHILQKRRERYALKRLILANQENIE